MLNNYPAIITAPQRWITEITPSGAVRHVQRLTPDHIIIKLNDIPALIAERAIVTDVLAAAIATAVNCRVG